MTRHEITLIEERDGEERRGPGGADLPPLADFRLSHVERNRHTVFASTEVSPRRLERLVVLTRNGTVSLTKPPW